MVFVTNVICRKKMVLELIKKNSQLYFAVLMNTQNSETTTDVNNFDVCKVIVKMSVLIASGKPLTYRSGDIGPMHDTYFSL